MDIHLHFTEQGTGFPLLLLHGNGEDGTYFVHQMEAFSRNRRVIALDTRGHGQSPRGTAPFTLDQFAADLLAFMDRQGLDQGVKTPVQLPIVLGYRLASLFKNPRAQAHAELLSLMVNEPHIPPAALGRLTMPVLVITGTNDMIREDHTRLIAASIPGARLAIIPGDHFIANKAPAAFNAAVQRFFQETEVSKEDMV